MNFTHETYCLFAKPLAKAVFDKYAIHILFPILQSAHESTWGNSGLSVKDNNYFGMTKGSWTGPTSEWPSTECHHLPPEKIQYWNRPGDIIEKKSNGKGGSILRVNIDFRKYESPLDSFMDWGQHIKEGYPLAYAAAIKPDISTFIYEVGKKYGTDGKYAYELTRLLSTIQPLLEENI